VRYPDDENAANCKKQKFRTADPRHGGTPLNASHGRALAGEASARWSWGRSEIQERRNGKDLNHPRIVRKYFSTFARQRILKSKNWLKCAGRRLAAGLSRANIAPSLHLAQAAQDFLF
jgi:hypothetical protein